MFVHISVSALMALPLLTSAGVIPVIFSHDDIMGRQVMISPVLPTLPRAVIVGRQVVTISPVISHEDGTDITGWQITIPALSTLKGRQLLALPAMLALSATPALPATFILPVLTGRQVPALLALPATPALLVLAGRQIPVLPAPPTPPAPPTFLMPPAFPVLPTVPVLPLPALPILAGRQIPVLSAPPAPPTFPAPPAIPALPVFTGRQIIMASLTISPVRHAYIPPAKAYRKDDCTWS
ncbi:hypothetical protein ARMGADRAFT_1123888 [Armillaria gallica]|uniref:Uncharacterized protein n=1 Tax=Armillaria gallica TaxID=47427 RepID=A0A2H3CYB6_ARMGA|nr:hypothetical protein ARMGADRAFT_1123888 [Armillaria gallica]